MPTLFEAKEQEMCHVNQGSHRKGEIKQYFWTNNRLKGQREKNRFNIEAFVALNVILCSYKNAKKVQWNGECWINLF